MSWLDGYDTRLPLTFENPDALLTDFTTLIRIVNNPYLSGCDPTSFRVTLEDGITVSPYYRWDVSDAGGLFSALVKTKRTLTSSGPNAGFLYYLPTANTDLSAKGGVYDAATTFAGAMNGYPGTLDVSDDLGLNNGINNGCTSASGQVAGAAKLTRTSKQYVHLGSSPNIIPASSCTVMGWHRTNGQYSGRHALIVNGSATSGSGGLVFGFTPGKYTWFQSGSSATLTGSVVVGSDVWRHVAATRSGVIGDWLLELFHNGSLDASLSTPVNPGTNQATAIGRFGNFEDYYLEGWLDEIIVSNVRRSPAWIEFHYRNTDQLQTTVTLGAPQYRPGSLIIPRRRRSAQTLLRM